MGGYYFTYYEHFYGIWMTRLDSTQNVDILVMWQFSYDGEVPNCVAYKFHGNAL